MKDRVNLFQLFAFLFSLPMLIVGTMLGVFFGIIIMGCIAGWNISVKMMKADIIERKQYDN